MDDLVVGPEDPMDEDVDLLFASHLDFARRHTPREDVHALDHDGLLAPEVRLFGLRQNGVLLGIGAIKYLDDTHAELKSIHTAEAQRRRGIGRSVVEGLLRIARSDGYERVSLETGLMDAFAPSRALYLSLGFEVCEPFADYEYSPNSVCMTLKLAEPRRMSARS